MRLSGITAAAVLAACFALGCQGGRTHGEGKQREREREHEHEHEHADERHEDARQHRGESRHAPRSVHISPEAIERSGIRIAEVLALPAGGGFDVPAEVQTEPDRHAHISSVVPGQIARVSASVGDHVEAGQALAVIRSVALGEARAHAQRAQANVEVAQSNFRRQEELQREGIGAQRQYLEAQAELRRAQAEQSAAERALEVYGRGGSGSEVAIKSPIDGRVIARHATVGEVIGPTDMLFEITDIARVWVVGRVYQQNTGQVHEGAPTVLTLQALPGRTWSGALDYVAPSLDERTRTLPVRVVLDNPEGVLRPGLFGTLSIGAGDAKAARIPAVANAAVQRVGDETVVFVPAQAQGEFRAVVVVTGSHAGELIRILNGLAPGERYVAEGAFVLKSELGRGELGEGHAH